MVCIFTLSKIITNVCACVRVCVCVCARARACVVCENHIVTRYMIKNLKVIYSKNVFMNL